MELEKMKELKEKIFTLTTHLDAAIEDYFKADNSGETEETKRIHECLSDAWNKMDSALDDLMCLIQEKKTEAANTAGEKEV